MKVPVRVMTLRLAEVELDAKHRLASNSITATIFNPVHILVDLGNVVFTR